jgi:hypothetical protein
VIIDRIDNFPVTVGGHSHSGWLPPNAAVPLPTPQREITLNLTIELEDESEDAGYLLVVQSSDGTIDGDTWHETLESAKQTAMDWYTVPHDAWCSE